MRTAHAHQDRHLEWDGCFNVRDLGRLPTTDGHVTRWGAVVRADALDGLTGSGWAALSDHGVRTVVDLRNAGERGRDVAQRPAGVTTVSVPLDVCEDREFWRVWSSGPQFATPLYYRPHLKRFPERSAAVLSAIAAAEPGGVVFHCVGGRDRAGQIAMLLLALVEVAADQIAGDYALSNERLRARYAAHDQVDQGRLAESFLAQRGTTAGELIVATLAELDVEERLVEAGLTSEHLAALRGRLVGSSVPAGSAQVSVSPGRAGPLSP